MRQNKSPLRGSVTQNTMSVRMRAREGEGASVLTRLGFALGCLTLLTLFSLWLLHTGWPQHKVREAQEFGVDLTRHAQFAIKDIIVEGRHETAKEDVFDAIAAERGGAILDFDVKATAARLAKLPWVASTIVERRMPDTIAVIITERVPTARWQHDEKLYVIDAEGHVLPSAKPEDFPGLPLVVGLGAEKEAQNFFALLRAYPDIREKMESIVRVSERRWDLHLAQKTVVRLPEENPSNALRRLSVLIAQDKILDRNVNSIDLRYNDKLIVDPATPVAQPATGAATGAHP